MGLVEEDTESEYHAGRLYGKKDFVELGTIHLDETSLRVDLADEGLVEYLEMDGAHHAGWHPGEKHFVEKDHAGD